MRTFYSVLVPADTTEEQLVNIIYEIRNAREGNYLNTYFPQLPITARWVNMQ